ncbi:protein phosphatase [Actinokineospora iranica]|uniref:Protein phosphatase n=2 Tax=Actinokineospora iranica TaxID=1271860 RepID=A0A1G6R405_9PSEU|nr:protein phosphatase [Actinokineospora iranica]
MLVIADGVGGAPAGEIASALAVRTVVAARRGSPAEAVARANAAVRAHARTEPHTAGMATTLDVAALVRRGARWWMVGAHVGDSVVLAQADTLLQLTAAHTLGAELVAAGHLTEEEGARHPQRAALVRAVGMEDQVRPDVWERPAIVGERYLLCTDGLTDALGAERLAALLASLRSAEPARCVDALVQAACEAGAKDNVTAVVADVAGGVGWRN